MKKENIFYKLEQDLRYSLNQLDLPENYDSDNSNSIYKLWKSDYRHFELDIKELEINKKLKRTDILNEVFTTNCKVVSERTKKILEGFNLPKHRFFSFQIKHNNEVYPYYFFFIDFEILDYIDYSKSEFYSENEYSEQHYFSFKSKQEHVQFLEDCKKRIMDKNPFKLQKDENGIPTSEAYEEYYEFRRHYYTNLQHKKLVLFKNLEEELDLFKSTSFYISNKLKKALLKEGITGFTIKEPRELEFSDMMKSQNKFSLKYFLKRRFFD